VVIIHPGKGHDFRVDLAAAELGGPKGTELFSPIMQASYHTLKWPLQV